LNNRTLQDIRRSILAFKKSRLSRRISFSISRSAISFFNHWFSFSSDFNF